MTPTAASEIVEQLMRVVTMIVFANMFMPHGLAYAAGGAVWAPESAPSARFWF